MKMTLVNSNTKPTIIIECSTLLRGNTGIGRWIELLLSELPKNGWNVIKIDRTFFGASSGILQEYYYYNVLLPKWLKSYSAGKILFLVPDNVSKFLRAPFLNTVYFVHDLIQLSPSTGYKGLRLIIYKFKLKQLKKAKAIVTTSAVVKDELLFLNWLEGKKIMPVAGFVGDIFLAEGTGTPPKVQLPKKFLLAVGTGEPRKNLSALLSAYAIDTDCNLPDLVLYGGNWQGIGWSNIENEAAQKGISHRIYHAKIVNDDELVWLCENALVFVFLSNAEGFGFPPLEALTRGTPVVVSDLPVFREVLADFANYVSAADPSSVLSAIINAMKQNSIGSKAFVSKEYSAARAIQRMLCSLNKII